MLKAQHRLRKTKEIELVMKRGKGVYGSGLGAKALKNKLDYSRFAFVVGIKVSKAAVKRNQIRRRMREIVRLNFDKIQPGFDVMIMARPGAKKFDYEELEKNLIAALKKLRLL
jgi:ribonuclease P protein component